MRFDRFLDRDRVAAAFRTLGFDSPEDAARCSGVAALYRRLLRERGEDGAGAALGNVAERLRNARHLAAKVEAAGRDLVGLHDPATSMLRHAAAPPVRSPVGGDVLDGGAVRYVRPDSIQSTQSSAAYLVYLYNLAKDEITPGREAFALDRRRPDLAKLVLSQDNLEGEITTLRLANEILTAQLIDNGIAGDEASLIEALKAARHPFAMPFDADNATVREALAAMGGLSLNVVGERGRADGFALGQDDFSLVANPAERLRLYADHGALLIERPGEAALYGTWFGLPDTGGANEALQFADAFAGAAGLRFEEFRALVGDDAPVVDEAGRSYMNMSYRFSAKGWYIELAPQEDGGYRTRGYTSGSQSRRDLPWHVHEMQNKCIRLQRRTGLAFHELDRLLITAVYGHPAFEARDDLDGGYETIQDEVLADGTGLAVAAHYVEWSQRHAVTLDGFCALLGEVNYLRRAGTGETSLMGELFDADAAEITERTRRHDPKGTVAIGEVDGDGAAGHLGAILRRGFRLSRAEWDIVVGEASGSADDPLDCLMLGRIYRLSHLLRLMGWSVPEGVELLGKSDAALLRTLARSEICGEVLPALDKVSWLAGWMKEAGFTAAELVTVLTEPGDAALYGDQDVVNWVLELQQGMAGALVTASEFGPYEDWVDDRGEPVEAITGEHWVEGLGDAGVLNAKLGLMVTGDRDALAGAVLEILRGRSVDLDDAGQGERAGELAGRLAARHGEQVSVLAVQVASQGESLSEGAVAPMLRWMGTGAYEALEILVGWDAGEDPSNRDGLELLFDLHRHALVAGKIAMDVPEVETAADRPSWLAAGMESPVTLRQVYLLTRLKGLQNARVSANAWLAYFETVEAQGPDEAQAENHERLSNLLDWPAEEIALLAVGPDIGIVKGRISTAEQADFLARRIELCREMSLGAGELIALEAGNGEDPDWPGARAAALIGLGRFEGGAHVGAAEGEVDEELRDALVGLYMTRVAAEDEALGERIRTDENLYEYLLVDVKVSKEVPTTRLLEATGSVQLYASRALESVDDAAFEDRAWFAGRWETAQQYRLWEANEKLALYPSNFIEPELRRGKTELYVDFERRLSQGDIDEDIVESGVHEYVDGLEGLSELQPHGFFFTRNAERTLYYFTARAGWEKHGYYYRRLEIDRARLGEGSPHAYAWEGWAKASLPIAAEHVYGVVPAYAWNRLFLFWFEMDEQTVAADGSEPATRYRLQAKYSRQNLNGSFTDPWSPGLGDGVDLDVTELVGAGGAASYRPEIYQPYYEPSEDAVFLFFALDAVTAGGAARTYEWKLAGASSDNEITATETRLVPPYRLDDYVSISHSLISVDDPAWGVDPREHSGYVVIYPPGHGADIFVQLSDSTWTLGIRAGRRLAYAWDAKYVFWLEKAGIATLLGVEGIVRINGVEVGRHTIVADEQPPNSNDSKVEYEPFQGEAEFGVDAPNEGTVEVALEGRIRLEADGGDELYVEEVPFVSTYVLEDRYLSHLFHGEEEKGRGAEQYLLSEDEDEDEEDGRRTAVAALFSTGVRAVAGLVYPGYDVAQLFALANQRPAEQGVEAFLAQVEASDDPDFGKVQEPLPESRLDFNGPFGIYAWELFLHLPLGIAARYAAAGKYEQARTWLQTVYDPHAEPGGEWGVWPLLPRQQGASLSVTDPDRIAVEEPAHYRLAAQRHYLRAMTGQGDALYRQASAESLRLAKMWYVSAKNLFLDVAGDAFAQSVREEWRAPALGDAAPEDFRPPYNEEIRDAYELLEERLGNLRDWRSIDGEPLNVALVASPVAPRQLQLAALSGAAPAEVAAGLQSALPYGFDTALAKARAAVENLMYFGDLVTRGLYRSDELALEELQAQHAHHVAEAFEVGGQRSLIESMNMELGALEKEQEEALEYLHWYEAFAGEYFNELEATGHALLGFKSMVHGLLISAGMVTGGLKLIPRIYGTAVGGQEPQGLAESGVYAWEQIAEGTGTAAEAFFHHGEAYRRRGENQMERDATRKVVERIALEIERLKYDIGEEEGTLEVLIGKAENAQALIEFHRRRVTNAEFRSWYAGRISTLYDSAYDITMRFCRLAERAYQVEVGDPTATFIRPAWDAQHRGLLAGQGLMLDLQRMDFAYMERYRPEVEGSLRVSLRDIDPVALEGLRRTGRCLFTVDEALFDAAMPDEYARRIESVRVRLRGVGKRGVRGRLVLLAHRVYADREKSEARSLLNVFGRQQIALSGATTDTAKMTGRGGRLRPFERCGAGATWMLAFPAAIEAVEGGRDESGHATSLDKLEDVVLDIRYTARTGG